MQLIDLTGKKFGKLTVIGRSHTAENGQLLWLCRCECGKEKPILGATLKSYSAKSCGCETGRFVDEVGKRYGRLTVISRDYSQRERRGAYWLCRCDCGKEVVVSGHSLRDENTKSCGCFHRDMTSKATCLPHGVSAKNRAIATMKANAKRRNITWELTDEQVTCLAEMDCHYCGVSPLHTSKGRNGSYNYNGLDRVNNNLGYTIDNVVTCCIVCNNAKRTMSLQDFLAWVERVYKHSIEPTR